VGVPLAVGTAVVADVVGTDVGVAPAAVRVTVGDEVPPTVSASADEGTRPCVVSTTPIADAQVSTRRRPGVAAQLHRFRLEVVSRM
jgi:hypothetical protein